MATDRCRLLNFSMNWRSVEGMPVVVRLDRLLVVNLGQRFRRPHDVGDLKGGRCRCAHRRPFLPPHDLCSDQAISKPGPLTNDSHEGTRRSKKKLHQPGCTSQLVSVGQRSANQNPFRFTTSPTVTGPPS